MLAILLIAIGGSQLHAAEVECFGAQDRYDGRSISDGIARQLWPSGFRPTAGMCRAGFFHGTIAKGDYDKVRSFFDQLKNYMNLFYLVSPGGDVNEAMMIGRFFRKYLIHTWAPDDFLGRFHLENFGSVQPPLDRCEGAQCVCASACALIWFGGVDRTGRVGLHRPRIGDPAFKTLPPAEAAKVYRKALDDIARYLDEMEAPRPMIDAMVVTDSSNIWWVDADGDHLEQPPTYAEWAEAACGHFSKQEENSLQNLLHKQSSGNLTGNDALLLQLLSIQHPARSRELNIGTSNLDASNGDRSKGSLRDPLWLRPGPAVIVEGDTSTIVPFVISVIHKIAHFSLHTAARRSRPHPSRGRHCGHRMKTAVQL